MRLYYNYKQAETSSDNGKLPSSACTGNDSFTHGHTAPLNESLIARDRSGQGRCDHGTGLVRAGVIHGTDLVRADVTTFSRFAGRRSYLWKTSVGTLGSNRRVRPDSLNNNTGINSNCDE